MSNSLEAKIVVLGSQGVGKTSLVHRYVKNAFTPPTTTSTIGASFLTKRVVDIDTSTVVRLQIWDTAGQERFRSISKLYYRGTLQIRLMQPVLFTDRRKTYLCKTFHKSSYFSYTQAQMRAYSATTSRTPIPSRKWAAGYASSSKTSAMT